MNQIDAVEVSSVEIDSSTDHTRPILNFVSNIQMLESTVLVAFFVLTTVGMALFIHLLTTDNI